MSDIQDFLHNGGAPRHLDLPDYTIAMYTNVKNTWQDAENLDDTHGYTSYIWIPDETHSVVVMKLAIFTEKFRAYSKSAAAGGGTVETTSGEGGHTHNFVVSDTQRESLEHILTTNEMPYHAHSGVTRGTESTDPVGSALGHTHLYYDSALSSIGSVGDHTHTVNIPNHTHPINFGIYEEDIAGRTLSAALYDPDGNLLKDFGTILTGEGSITLDLTGYFSPLKYGFYRVELTASGRMRVRLVFYELCRMYID